jgi:hypothetical protein
MRKHESDNYADAWKQYTGGYWAKLVIPFEIWTIRPDGSIAGVQTAPLKKNQKANPTGE